MLNILSFRSNFVSDMYDPNRPISFSYSDLTETLELLPAQAAPVYRFFIPENPGQADGFDKYEFALDLRTEPPQQLYFSLKPTQTCLLLLNHQRLKKFSRPSLSPFFQLLDKNLEGLYLSETYQIEQDRSCVLRFQKGESDFLLVLQFIPARPAAWLYDPRENKVLGSLRNDETHPPFPMHEFPKGWIRRQSQSRKTPQFPSEAFLSQRVLIPYQNRVSSLTKLLSKIQQKAEKKKEGFLKQIEKSVQDPPYAEWARALTSLRYQNPEPIDMGGYFVWDIGFDENGNPMTAPVDQEKGILDAKSQVDLWFKKFKKSKTRREESEAHLTQLNETLKNLNLLHREVEALKDSLNLDALSQIELKLKPLGRENESGLGYRQYFSKEGLRILVGRSVKENLELTLKVAKGNDLWLHLKGQAGSHVIIQIPPKKTASLETLLDAAHLCIVQSGGKDWGSAEVDYCFRKYVKRIKGTDEVQYSQNKTLFVRIEEDRLKRLYLTPG